MTDSTLETVLEHAQQLNPIDQARLIAALQPTATPNNGHPAPAADDDNLAEQHATWVYVQQVLDDNRLSVRPLFPQTADQR